eukprot:TRINITY_DN36521_c0_g1_i1.p1 TRINITY_DN36521_c0_g1~~TRINITY_DN36521_c0_g1_i1.p1  ORF type:complete len:1144 (-),score=167.28 TRINITY_DN36521_c0_g1_i1:126-3305(-)
MIYVGGGRRRRTCKSDTFAGPPLADVLRPALFPFQAETLRRVMLDHLERIFDIGLVYHDFYAGTLAENGGPVPLRPSLVKRLSEFAIGKEGDPEGYAYPQFQQEQDGSGSGGGGVRRDSTSTASSKNSRANRELDIKPTTVLELVGQFYYHAHNKSQCRRSNCAAGSVPVWHLGRVAPLHMRRAFFNYYHYTTVGLSRLVALLPTLLEDLSIDVLVPEPNWKGQAAPFILESLQILGVSKERVRFFPPCWLVFADEMLMAGAGPRSVYGRGPDGRVRSVMADVADRRPSRAVRAAMLRAVLPWVPSASGGVDGNVLREGERNVLLIDRQERRTLANVVEVTAALQRPPLEAVGPIYCEVMGFAEQVRRFQTAAAVVAVHGACLSNSLYMPAGALVVDAVPVKHFMGAGLVMPLDCGITWFWTLTSNVGVRYRPMLLADGDFDAAAVYVPASRLRDLLLRELQPVDPLRGTRVGGNDDSGATCGIAVAATSFIGDSDGVNRGGSGGEGQSANAGVFGREDDRRETRTEDVDKSYRCADDSLGVASDTRNLILDCRVGPLGTTPSADVASSLAPERSASRSDESGAERVASAIPSGVTAAFDRQREQLLMSSRYAGIGGEGAERGRPEGWKPEQVDVDDEDDYEAAIAEEWVKVDDQTLSGAASHSGDGFRWEHSCAAAAVTVKPDHGLCAAMHGQPLLPVGGGRSEAPDRAWAHVEQACATQMLSGWSTRDAFRCLQRSHESRRAPGTTRGDFTTSLRKLWHDCEQLAFYEETRDVQGVTRGAGKFLRALYDAAKAGREATPDRPFEVRIPEGDERRELWARLHNTAVYLPHKYTAVADDSVISASAASLAAAERSFRENGHAVIDGLLSSRALRHLRRFLQEASVYYYQPRKIGRYFLALLEDGLATPILAEVVMALQLALPETLGRNRAEPGVRGSGTDRTLALCEARAWKEDNSGFTTPDIDGSMSPGLEAKGATVGLLLWTVSEKSLAPSSEGEVSPLLMLPLPGGDSRPVEYMANRVVLWRDDCNLTAPSWNGPVVAKRGFLRRLNHLVLRFAAV